MAFSDLFKNHRPEPTTKAVNEQADVKKWVENNDRKSHSCQDCVYRYTKHTGEKYCELSKRPIEQVIDGVSYPIRWDKCDGFKMVKSCENCGNQKSSTLMIADTPLTIEFCPYKHKDCKDVEMWISRVDALNKIVLEQPKSQSEKDMDKLHKEVAKQRSKVENVEKVEIPVVDKDEGVPMQANPTIATMVSEISTTMKEEEERSEPEPEPVEVVKAKEIKEEQELHEEHLAPILNNITNGNLDEIKSGELEIDPIIAKPEPEPIEDDTPEQLVAKPEPAEVGDEPTAPPEDKEVKGKEYVFSYNDYERLPGESRKEFKRRVRQELGIKD